MRTVWRIGTDTVTYTANNLDGKGAERTGGRWNPKGIPMVYCSETIALACLETVVHLNNTLPLNHYLVKIEIPEAIWKSVNKHPPKPPAVGWDAIPPGKVSQDYGRDWVKTGITAIIRIPSVIVPEEWNVLINPAHPDAFKIKATKIRKWIYDPR